MIERDTLHTFSSSLKLKPYQEIKQTNIQFFFFYKILLTLEMSFREPKFITHSLY